VTLPAAPDPQRHTPSVSPTTLCRPAWDEIDLARHVRNAIERGATAGAIGLYTAALVEFGTDRRVWRQHASAERLTGLVGLTIPTGRHLIRDLRRVGLLERIRQVPVRENGRVVYRMRYVVTDEAGR
jgi:hypothetical protein